MQNETNRRSIFFGKDEILVKPNIKRYFKISFPRENKAIKHDLVEFKVQCLKVFATMATNLPSCFFIQFLEQLLKFTLFQLYFVEIC